MFYILAQKEGHERWFDAIATETERDAIVRMMKRMGWLVFINGERV